MAFVETNIRLVFHNLQENLKYQSVAYFWYLVWVELSKGVLNGKHLKQGTSRRQSKHFK